MIKPHPNQIDLNDSVLAELKKLYPNITIISNKISNKQLVDSGISCAVTIYGSVAHEMAFLGIPTIAASHHPHISFDFCKTAQNKLEYAELLKNYRNFKLDKLIMKKQSLIFYYMHNLHFDTYEKSLLDAKIKLYYYYAGSSVEKKEFPKDIFMEITDSPAFEKEISKLILC